MEIYQGLIADVRLVKTPMHDNVLQFRRADPLVDASGAVCGFRLGGWQFAETVHFDTTAGLANDMAESDLAASGGIVDAP